MSKYDDIINMPYVKSTKHPHMSLHDRAAQFAPFAALKGYDEDIIETARLTDARDQRSEDDLFILNDRLHILMEHLHELPEVEITYFVPDERKSGGSYQVAKGNVRRIDGLQRLLFFSDGKQISLNDVFEINGEIFE